ncbi:MAG: hypothetical protein Q4G10_00640 [Bacteroidia bacterium]|nr:hypothetical protein [Bacteroidia bacterium]
MKENNQYKWKYCSLGGVVRVKIENGEDLAHLGELDQKLWTVLSCPVDGLEFDQETLALMDTDADGKIRVPEVVAAANWLTSVLKDKDSILKGDKTLALSNINTDNEAGQNLYNSAKQILANLGKDAETIELEDVLDTTKIFAGTKFNGDGVITAVSADDEALKALIAKIGEAVGTSVDRNGEAGVTAEQIEAFYAAAEAYAAWQAAAELPYGTDTEAVSAAVDAVDAKVKDYFMRCKLIAFDADAAGAVDVSVEKIGAIAGGNLVDQAAEISLYPIARPCKEAVLPFDGINPAWKAAVDTAKALVPEFADKAEVTEAEWDAVVSKLAPYVAWKGAKAGAEVEPLGLDAVKDIIAAGQKQALLDLVAEDKKYEAEANGIDEVCKLVRFYSNFGRLLNNYVNFTEFYARKEGSPAVFETGKLYIDQRCCELCIPVKDMGTHGDMAAQSGMFLLYCTCTSKVKAGTMDIVAVMTDGSISSMRPGKHGVFYDLEGNDWDATITKVVDNPLSVKQAFWSPYRKLANFINDKIDKSASEKDSKATAGLLSKADGGEAKSFDIGKFAGITAIATIAIAAITGVITIILSFLASLKWWQIIILIAAIMLVISGPACFIAWKKLRKRNLGPVLNANGWAVNSNVLVNILFGKTLTSVAKYPKMNIDDPYSMKTPLWKKILRWFIFLLVVAFAALYFTNNLKFMGIERKAKVVEEPVVEQVAEPAPVEAAPVEEAVIAE